MERDVNGSFNGNKLTEVSRLNGIELTSLLQVSVGRTRVFAHGGLLQQDPQRQATKVSFNFSEINIGFSVIDLDLSEINIYLLMIELDFSEIDPDLSASDRDLSTIDLDLTASTLDFSVNDPNLSEIDLEQISIAPLALYSFYSS